MRLDNGIQAMSGFNGNETVATDDRVYMFAKDTRDMVQREKKEAQEDYLNQINRKTIRVHGSKNHDEEARHDRLYKLAKLKKEKLEKIQREKREAEEDYLNHKERRFKGQGSRNHDEEARHDRLYRLAKLKEEKLEKIQKEKRDDEEDYLNQINEWTMSVQETRASTNRLYDRSKKKQIAGRQLREAIEKKHAPRAPTPSRKIRAEDASKMYDRAMMRKLSLELRREAEGINKQYVSPLLNPLVLSEENRPESRSRPDSRIRSRPDSRIRSRSRLRSPPLPNHKTASTSLPVQSSTRRSSTPNIRYSNSRSLTPSNRIPNTRVRSITPNRNRRYDTE